MTKPEQGKPATASATQLDEQDLDWVAGGGYEKVVWAGLKGEDEPAAGKVSAVQTDVITRTSGD